MIVLYSPERVAKVEGRYFARIINFTDFFVQLSKMANDYHLALLCDSKVSGQVDIGKLTPVVGLEGDILELPYLKNRYQSFLYSFYVAFIIRKYIKSQSGLGRKLAFAAPGLNAITFVLSYLLPRSTRWYLFIRGDTKKGIGEMYQGSIFRRLMTGAIDIFQWRVSYLIRNGRGRVFVYGQALEDKFYSRNASRSHVVSPLLSEEWLETKPRIKTCQSWEGRNPRVLFAGRLSEEKNIVELIKACEKSSGSPYEFDLTIVGDGHMENVLKKLTRELAVDDRVSFTGRVSNGPELIGIFDSHDIFCLPSITEGTPRAIAESVARGLPVVASDVGSVKHMFSNGVVHLLDGLSASDILKSLSWVLDNFQERTEKAEESRFEAKNHTLLCSASKVNQIIENDLQESSRL